MSPGPKHPATVLLCLTKNNRVFFLQFLSTKLSILSSKSRVQTGFSSVSQCLFVLTCSKQRRRPPPDLSGSCNPIDVENELTLWCSAVLVNHLWSLTFKQCLQYMYDVMRGESCRKHKTCVSFGRVQCTDDIGVGSMYCIQYIHFTLSTFFPALSLPPPASLSVCHPILGAPHSYWYCGWETWDTCTKPI